MRLKAGLKSLDRSEKTVDRRSPTLGRVPLLVSLLSFALLTALGACTPTSHATHVRSDAEICQSLGHAVDSQEYGICTKALNTRRCEDKSPRDPMCQ